jgi:DNA processing protein
MSERNYCLAFSFFSGIGPIKFGKLIKHYGSAENVWKSSEPELKSLLGEKLTLKFGDFKKKFEIEKYTDELLRKQISFVCINEKDYPQRLKKIPNPPIVLYIKGAINFNQKETKYLAIVGTRRITSYGKSVTQLFSSSLAEAGLTIASGLALGVDGEAHKACLDVDGKTIAVMGNGVDICFPRENQKIYDKILEKNGVIISEFPPGEPPSVGSFPARNRIVAGLSDGVLVTEGASDSGSLITANFGLDFGRKVFAVPGPITSSLSAAPLRLIEKGAKLVVSPDDLLKELGIKNHELRKNKKKFAGLSSEEKKIVELLENENLQFDEIVGQLNINPSKIGTTLSMMEMKGIIKNSGGNYSIIAAN